MSGGDGGGSAWGVAGGSGDSVTATVARVLARLGVGQVLRLRRSGPGGTVEVQARADGALEVPTAVLGGAEGSTEGAVEGSAVGEEATGPHLLFGRHRTDELARRLVAAIDDLELVTSSIVDAAGIERLLDGSGARTDVTVDGHLDRWDLPMIDQVRRYLAQRYSIPLSSLDSPWQDLIAFTIGRLPHLIQVLDDPQRIRVAALVVQDIATSDELDLALHRLNPGDGLVRFRHQSEGVFAEVVLPAPTFMGQHLEAALDAVRGNEVMLVTDAIVKAFGGEASFRRRYQPTLSDFVEPDDPTDPTDTTDPTTDPEEDHT
jgi:hypothetical protein